jgi:electron transfer flavoprotein beta subunit
VNIVACYKIVPEEQDIAVKPDRTLAFEKAELKIGQYDLPAIEAGVKLVEEAGGKMSILSIGSKQIDNSELIKGALSRGPQELFMVIDDDLDGADANQTASVLAAALRSISFDLVICGEGSSDIYAQQVGAQLGEMLGVNVFNAVSRIVPRGDSVLIERTLEKEIEVLEVPLPAVLSVTTDINLPRIPQLKDILAAGKKPVTKWGLADVGVELNNAVEVVSTLAPVSIERKQIIIEGNADEDMNNFLQNIRKEL